MPLSKNFRWVLVTSLSIVNESKVPPHVSKFTFEEIEQILMRKHQRSETDYLFQKETMKIRIRDIQTVNENFLCMLISIGDKNAPDTVYEDFQTGDRREFEKNDQEGNVITGHVIISRNETDNVHLTLIEKVPGLSISLIERYLRFLFNDEQIKKSYEDDGQMKHYRPLFEILGHKSNTLRSALETGRLEDIEFVSIQERTDGLDEYGYIQEQVSQAKFVIKRGIDTNTADQFFQNVLNKFKKGDYNKMFVRIKTGSGQTKLTEIDTDEEDILSQYFVQNEIIHDFSEPLKQAEVSIREDIAQKMLTKLTTLSV